MYAMDFDIKIGAYALKVVDCVEIKRSVESLSDTATIELPAYVTNRPTEVNSKIKIGDSITIKLGYNSDLKTEFEGYLDAIKTDNGKLVLECIDELRMFKVAVKDCELKNKSVKYILEHVQSEIIGKNGAVECTFESTYDKFVIRQATGYDVLKKIQENFKANIFFADGKLHCHAPYKITKSEKKVTFDFGVNIEHSDLSYKTKTDRPVEVEITLKKKDGKTVKQTYGTTGGEVKKIEVFGVSESSLQEQAESEYNVFCFDGYEGNFTGWLVPYVAPSDSAKIIDNEFPERTGYYYVVATETSFSESGGKRKVVLGRKLTN